MTFPSNDDQPSAGQQPYGQPLNAQPTGPQSGQPSSGQPQSGQPQFDQQPYAQQPYAQQPGPPPAGYSPPQRPQASPPQGYGPPPYAPAGYGPQGYAPSGYGPPPYYASPIEKPIGWFIVNWLFFWPTAIYSLVSHWNKIDPAAYAGDLVAAQFHADRSRKLGIIALCIFGGLFVLYVILAIVLFSTAMRNNLR